MASNIPISTGSGAASVATEQIGNFQFQQIKVVGGETGSTSVMGVNPDRSISVSIIGIPTVVVGGSVTAIFTAAANQSVSGAVTAPPGSVAAVRTDAASVITVSQSSSVVAILQSSSILAVPVGSVVTVWQNSSVIAVPTGNQSVSGAVTAPPGSIMSVTNPAGSVTGVRTDLASVITVSQSSSIIAVVTGSVVAITNNSSVITVWKDSSVVAILQSSSILAVPVGSVITVWKDSSVLSVPVGSVITVLQAPSIVGTYAEDAAHTTGDKGVFVLGVRNDAVASFTSANLEYIPLGTDSAGRTLTKPFAAEESRVEGYNSVVSTSVTTLVAAAGTGLRNYITDIQISNTGATTTLITFRSGGGTSVLGYTIAPTGGGSNITLQTPMRTLANETFDFQPTTASSILFATVKGYKAP